MQNAELSANVGEEEEEQERYASVVQVVFLVEHEEKMAKGHGADVRQDGTAGSTWRVPARHQAHQKNGRQ